MSEVINWVTPWVEWAYSYGEALGGSNAALTCCHLGQRRGSTGGDPPYFYSIWRHVYLCNIESKPEGAKSISSASLEFVVKSKYGSSFEAKMVDAVNAVAYVEEESEWNLLNWNGFGTTNLGQLLINISNNFIPFNDVGKLWLFEHAGEQVYIGILSLNGAPTGSEYVDIDNFSPTELYITWSEEEPPIVDYNVETLEAGWTAELETKAPPSMIDRTWAHIRGELLSLLPSVLSQAAHGIYLGFNYGKTIGYGHTQWYIPPGGATKIYLPRLFSASIGGLQPGTTYHYRALARLGSLIDVALLNGSVTLTGDYQGLPTQCYFEWGETTEYGYETDPKTMQYSREFASIVAQLDPEVTYHCRAVAMNAAGTLYGEDIEFSVQGACYGEDQSFQTLAGLPPPVFGSGAGYEYRTSKEVLEQVSKLSVGRGYGDSEGKFNYESRNVR